MQRLCRVELRPYTNLKYLRLPDPLVTDSRELTLREHPQKRMPVAWVKWSSVAHAQQRGDLQLLEGSSGHSQHAGNRKVKHAWEMKLYWQIHLPSKVPGGSPQQRMAIGGVLQGTQARRLALERVHVDHTQARNQSDSLRKRRMTRHCNPSGVLVIQFRSGYRSHVCVSTATCAPCSARDRSQASGRRG
jgi:hypothetical protein